MVVSIIEVSNRRAELLKSKALKKLKEQRKATRSAMQRYEGSTALDQDDQTTYDDLNISMVILNALSDHLLRTEFLPKSWDQFTLGSEFDRRFTPLLRSNAEDLWVEYFDCNQPKDLLRIVVGNAAAVFDKKTATTPPRAARPSQPAPQPAASGPTGSGAAGSGLMDMIRSRMPSHTQAQYSPKRG